MVKFPFWSRLDILCGTVLVCSNDRLTVLVILYPSRTDTVKSTGKGSHDRSLNRICNKSGGRSPTPRCPLKQNLGRYRSLLPRLPCGGLYALSRIPRGKKCIQLPNWRSTTRSSKLISPHSALKSTRRVFMHDNASIHASNSTKVWLRSRLM